MYSICTYIIDFVIDVALWSGELSGALHLEVDDEEEIVPDLVVVVYVVLVCHVLVLKLASLQACTVCVCGGEGVWQERGGVQGWRKGV